jgi:transposase
MHIRYRVELDESERQHLDAVVAGGTRAVRRVKRAQILLAAAAGVADAEIAATVRVGTSTVYRTKRQHFVERGLERALSEGPRPGGKRKLAATEEVLLVATACTQPPAGRVRWTLALLAAEVVRLTVHSSVSRATIGRRLAENDLKPWHEKMWCVPHIDLCRLHGGRAGAVHDAAAPRDRRRLRG